MNIEDFRPRSYRATKLFMTVSVLILMLAGSKWNAWAEEDLNASVGKMVTLDYEGKTYRYDFNIHSYLMIGTDNSAQAEENEDAIEDGYISTMADSLLLLVVDSTKNCYTVLQLDRNTITEIPVLDEVGEEVTTFEQQLCTAYFYGQDIPSASQNMMTAVSRLLKNTPIDDYVTVAMDDIPKLNQLVDGVTVTLQDDFSERDPEMVPGATLTLTDQQAYYFLHDRMNIGDGMNTSRMERQRTYISAFGDKVMAKTNEDAKFPERIYKQMDSFMTTSTTDKDLSRIVNAMKNYEDHGIVLLEGTGTLGTKLDDGLEHEEVYLDEDALMKTVIDLFYIE